MMVRLLAVAAITAGLATMTPATAYASNGLCVKQGHVCYQPPVTCNTSKCPTY